MKVLLYGINYSPELTGIGKYSGEMAQWMAAQGHEVRVVTAPPYYPDWQVWQGYRSYCFSKRLESNVTVIRCPVYVPSRPTAIKRLLHLTSFSFSSSFALFSQLHWKPDLIINVAPTLFCTPQTILFSKLSGAKSVLHIQDYEVDAFFGLSIKKSDRLKSFAFAMERILLNSFDRVSTISSGMLRRAEKKGVAKEKLCFFPNWSETNRFSNISRNDELLTRLGVDPSKKILLYSGNIGEKQGLEIVLDAAEAMAARKDVTFLIVGEGAGKARLMESSLKRSLSNVIFAPLQPYEDLPALLASANCHLVIQRRGAADAVLPSKLTNILAVGGNSLITADPDTTLGLLCSEHPGIAALVEPESVGALIEGIEAALEMPTPNFTASRYAGEFLEKEKILNRFLAEI